MYQKEYERWMAADLEDPDLKPELSKIEGNDDEIKERFAVALKFGTAGLRGVLGAGTNRMKHLCGTSGNPGTCKLGKDPGRNPDGCDQL